MLFSYFLIYFDWSIGSVNLKLRPLNSCYRIDFRNVIEIQMQTKYKFRSDQFNNLWIPIRIWVVEIMIQRQNLNQLFTFNTSWCFTKRKYAIFRSNIEWDLFIWISKLMHWTGKSLQSFGSFEGDLIQFFSVHLF